MSTYTLPLTAQLPTYETLQEGLYLLLVNCHKTPPHLAMVLNGTLYEYTVKPTKHALTYAQWSARYTKLKTPVLAIKLNSLGYSVDELQTQLITAFNFTNQQPTSCLMPINKAIQAIYNINTQECYVVFDLLAKLQFSDVITHTLLCNPLPTLPIINNELLLKRYSAAVVQQHIAELKKV